AHVSFPTRAFPSPLSRRLFVDRAIERLSALPGVEGAALTEGVPPTVGPISFGNIALDGQPETERHVELPGYVVRPNFFAITGIPIREGRAFIEGEPDTSVVVSASFAASMWPGGSAVGHRFRLDKDDPWKEVVGVAGEVHSDGLDDAM